MKNQIFLSHLSLANLAQRMIQTGLLAGLVILPGACSPEAEPTSEETDTDRPNIVFILSDDQGWADVGYHGSEIQTPTMDRLASEGIRLSQHYVHPVCSPTRAALMTGMAASRFGILGAIGGDSQQYLPPQVPTLAGQLSDADYRTHISGKWHLALNKDYGPTRYGFQTSYGYLHGQIDPYNHLYKFGDRTWHRNDEFLDEEGHATDLISEDAVRFIEQASDEPFFLYVAYSVPHYPLAEPDEWSEMYEDKFPERSRRLYAASISHTDAGIGSIVDALDRSGVRKNTLIVYSSDNGGQESWLNTADQYDGRYPPDPVLGDNTPLRGWKGQVYEGGIRVPAFANWPGTLEPGEFSDPLFIADWMPTFLHLAESDSNLPGTLDGKNMWPYILDSASVAPPRTIYIKAQSGSTLRHGEWKLIELRSGELELFNIEEDPYEGEELSSQNPEKVKELLHLLREQQELDGEPLYWGDNGS